MGFSAGWLGAEAYAGLTDRGWVSQGVCARAHSGLQGEVALSQVLSVATQSLHRRVPAWSAGVNGNTAFMF